MRNGSFDSLKSGYNTVDFLKLIMAVCIVGIHVHILDLTQYSQWIVSSMIFRLAVPFFFAVSGYFIAGKLFKNGQIDNKDGRLIIKILW